jgi:predicted nucleic acid-binding protein
VRVLLDTCVLSEIRHPQGNAAVKKAVSDLDSDDIFISVLSVGEIAKGIALLRDGARKRELAAWLQALELHHEDQILPIDLETAHIWGELTIAAEAARPGYRVPAVDGLLAATANRHGLRVMTRNVDDFKPTGVLLINPWEGS